MTPEPVPPPTPEPAGEHPAAFAMTENMPVGMFVTEMLPDGTRQFVFVSNRLLEMLAVEREAVMRDWRAIHANIHPDDFAAFLKPSEESWNGITVFRWEGRALVRGETRWFSAESNPRPRPGGGAYWDGVIFDVTTRKRAEAEVEAARSREQAAAAQKMADLERGMKTSLMAAAVAHDVKQPLGMALFHAQQLLDRFADQPLEGDAREILDKLAAESRHVADSIERMRGLLRSIETVREPCDLCHVSRSAVLATGSLAELHGVAVRTILPPEAVVVVGDAAQVQVAVANLIANAVEAVATREGGVREVRVAVSAGADAVVCAVGDSGPGLGLGNPPPGDRPRPADKRGGTGMGLHIVRAVLANHRGRLESGTSPLGGAEFRIVLPRT
ncbi:MAG: sensor histidine kinase [Planctomycetaceae bacterium]